MINLEQIYILMIVVFLSLLVIPMVLEGLEVSFNYVFRTNKVFFSFTDFIEKVFKAEYHIILLIYIIVSMVFGLISAMFGDFNDGDSKLFLPANIEFSVLWLVLPFSLTIARWVVDICRNFKLNHKTGDSERLAELEKEIAKLKAK